MSAALENLSATADWKMDAPSRLRSPLSGARLFRDGPYSLAAPGERWPLLDGIAYLRAGRAALISEVFCAIDSGDIAGAIVLLLDDAGQEREHDVSRDDLRHLVEHRDTFGFREAMRALGYGFAGEYFAYRWSDPTYFSGLALAEAYWPSTTARIIEPACGTGHFLRAFTRHAAYVCGGDISFANLWLARHFVAPSAHLVCFDATERWPFEDGSADLVFCHDALHLLAVNAAAVAQMQRVAGRGSILCGHMRNLLQAPAPHDGSPVAAADYAELFGASVLYDDAELTASLIARRAPRASSAEALAKARTVAVAAGGAASLRAQKVTGRLATPARGAPLRRNPLYCEEADGDCVRRFPSQRYAEEIGRYATYPSHVTARNRVTAGADPADDALIRRGVWVDLPPRW